LRQDAATHGAIGIAAQIACHGEEVGCIAPNGDTLQVSAADGDVVTQGNGTQTQVTAVFYPSVAETRVAHGVFVNGTWDVCFLSARGPTVVHRRGLVDEQVATFQQRALVVEDVVAQ